MKVVKIRIVENSSIIKYLFPKWVVAFTLGKSIFCRGKWSDLTEVQKNHEKIHVAQYVMHGVLKFLYVYFIKEITKKYRSKSFEVEAYNNQTDFDYIKTVYEFEVV